MKATLFDMSPSPIVGRPHIDVLPCSVVDVEPEQHAQRRRDGGHNDESSRSQYSHFPTAVGDLCFQLFLRDKQRIYDPFAGWGERASLARTYGKVYEGIDVSDASIAFARERYGAEHIKADAVNYRPHVFDGLITCPPYWSLESYSDSGLDAAPTWAAFCDGYWNALANAYDVAETGAIFCVLTGDWRDGGVYYDLTYRTQRVFDDFGAVPVDSVVVSRKQSSKIKIMIPQAVRLGYTVKVHETLNVWSKS